MDETKQLIKAQFVGLPQNIRVAITSGAWRKPLEPLFASSTFTPPEQTTIENEILYALLGLEHPEALTENIASHVQKSPGEIEELLGNTYLEIFTPEIVESLKRFQEREDGGDSASHKDPYREILEVQQTLPANYKNFSGTPYQPRQQETRAPLSPLPSYQKAAADPQRPTPPPPEKARDPYREPPV